MVTTMTPPPPPPLLLLPLPMLLLLILVSGGTNAELCTEAICRYDFAISYRSSMVYMHPEMGAYDVQLNATEDGYLLLANEAFRSEPDPLIGTSVGLHEVISTDGTPRNIITINGQFPGPNIEVMEGAQVVVRVSNRLFTDDLSIHWHGMYMRATPWMDGVPGVSHCPHIFSSKFTYRFVAEPSGTHFYHSYTARQQLDGLYGMLIVHPRVAPSLPRVPEYHVTVGDWFPVHATLHQILDPHSPDPQDRGSGRAVYAHPTLRDYIADGNIVSGSLWYSGLINGRGRYDLHTRHPLTSFRVVRGQRYRFRMANVGAEFGFRISVDSHNLRVIATDGHDIEAMVVRFIVLYVGETVDFELVANQNGERYWMRVETLMKPDENEEALNSARAVILYAPYIEGPDPETTIEPCTEDSSCDAFNCPFSFAPPHFFRRCRAINEVKTSLSNRQLEERYGVFEADVKEIFLNLGSNGSSSINGASFIPPSSPPYQRDSVMVSCQNSCSSSCDQACQCTQSYELLEAETIQLVVSNIETTDTPQHRPFTVHGHDFAVVHVGYAPVDDVTGLPTAYNTDVVCDDDGSICRHPRWNTSKPPTSFDTSVMVVKHTVNVPARGYAVLRFRANNPGFWIASCPLASERVNGMSVLLQEAVQRLGPPPKGFPTCLDFVPTDEEFADYLAMGDHLEFTDEIQYVIDDGCP